MKLILVRHGQSTYNLENRFTGWKDVELTPDGIKEAGYAGNELKLADNRLIGQIPNQTFMRIDH